MKITVSFFNTEFSLPINFVLNFLFNIQFKYFLLCVRRYISSLLEYYNVIAPFLAI